MNNELLINAAGISKKYGKLIAINNVNIDVYSGRIYGIAGLNGAGKSTLLAILAGVLRPDVGTVQYWKASLEKDGSYKSTPTNSLRIGYVPQDIALFPDLSVFDNLKFWSLAGKDADAPRQRGIFILNNKPGHSGGDRKNARSLRGRIIATAGIAGLSDNLRQPVRSLSGGMKQRVNIAAALVTDPDILIMDEPTAGLDVKNRRDILNFINSLAKNTQNDLAVIYTSHQSGELEMVSDHLLLLDKGRAVFDGPPAGVFNGKYAGYTNIDDILYSLGAVRTESNQI